MEQRGIAITRCPFVCTDKFSGVNKRLLLLALALTAVCPLPGAGQRADPAPAPATLSDFFRTGVVLQDRNGDGAIDFVDARIVLPEQPSSAELAAASDIAARLGFETSAMNLPLAVARGYQPADTPTIFVGAKSLAGSGATLDAIGGAALKAGDGAVVAFSLRGRTAVAVLGGDDAGLASAAVMLAGHLPYVWDQKSPTTDKIADEVKQFLVGKGVTASSASASGGVHARERHGGVDRVTVALQMANGGDFVKAMVALNQFKATGVRDAKRPLSYASVRAIQVRLARARIGSGLDRSAAGRDAGTGGSAGARAAARRRPEGRASISRRSTRTRARWPIPTTISFRIASTCC